MSDAVDVALKEWQSVCRALAEGRQTILLRKGGIQEGPDGFAITHERFALLPTRLHQDADMLKPSARALIDGGEDEPATFDLTHGGEVADIHVVPSREALDRLDNLHVWNEKYLDLRWNYKPERPLYLTVVRAFALATPTTLANTYKVAGCRSWVPLEAAIEAGEATLDAAAFEDRRAAVRAALD